GEQPCGNRKLDAFFEAHIEQGPILEDSECTIGVVLGGQGQQWYDLSITGQDAHSGSTPMPNRKDALVAAADIIKAVREVAKAHAPHGVGTVGHAEIMPNSRNTIPGVVRLTVDLRHPDDKTLLAMGEMFLSECNNAKHSEGVELTIEKILERPSVNFDKDCIRMVRESAEALGYSHQEIYSGAGHDACNISLTAPTTMIFIPCAGGLSHNEAESATPEDVEAGCNVLLHSILGRANKAPAMPSEP
ncbi:MAG: hydantoinase/carbamoylase family amidase, partial [Rhodospirillales bacterium]|nr:hydantoinase/carbamoylase family amidase [Rhodospirillales bacterium]